jgi:hypothetical protein
VKESANQRSNAIEAIKSGNDDDVSQKHKDWYANVKESSGKQTQKSNENIMNALVNAKKSSDLKLNQDGLFEYKDKLFSLEVATEFIGCSSKRYPVVLDYAYELFGIDVKNIEGAIKKRKEVKKLMEGKKSKAEWTTGTSEKQL